MNLKNTSVLLLALLLGCKTQTEVTQAPAEMEEVPAEVEERFETTQQQKGVLRQKEYELREYRATRERHFDLLHTSLDLSFDFEKKHVLGKAKLKLKPYFYDQRKLELDAKDFEVYDVSVIREDENYPLNFKYDQKKLLIYLPGKISSSDTLDLSISYTAKPYEGGSGGSAAITDDKGMYFINPTGEEEGKPTQIWTQGETEHNSKWFPTIDAPNERATHDFKLTVPEGYQTFSNGKLLGRQDNEDGTRTDHWEMDMPHAPYLAAVVVGDFEVVEDQWEDVPLRYIVEKGYKEGAAKVFENTPEMIGFFSELLGVRYPWQKYDQVVVRDFVSGAMENTTLSIFMEALNLDEREALDSEWEGIIAHELFHQWFGDYVTTESWSNLPLNEAFANYSEYLWEEFKHGKDAADLSHVGEMEQYFSEAEGKQVDLIRFYYDNDEEMFDSHSYAKGGRILHMLRKYLGDEAFFASLNHYLEKHALSSVEVHDLRLAFEKVSGKDLNWFFNQWFLDSGHPELDVRIDESVPGNILLTVRQQQPLGQTPLYKLPFKVQYYIDGVRYEREFVLEEGEQFFALENGELTDVVLFDEGMELLAKKQTFRGFDRLVAQFENAEAGIARYEALDSLTTHYTRQELGGIFRSGMEDRFGSLRELALDRLSSSEVNFQFVEDLVYQMAQEDEKNSVRAAAIEVLAQNNPEKYQAFFRAQLDEPSLYVAGAALAAYLGHEGNDDRQEVAEGYMDHRNIRVVVALANYFSAREEKQYAGWFHDNLNKLSGESLYYFLGYYGDFFARLEEQERNVAIEKLYEVAAENPANYIRLGAFQSLFGFYDEDGVKEKLKRLNEEETDSMVRQYQGFYLQNYGD
ncbi:M1 family metallopeptidase [Litoribacter alkaliphilus]|uniref:Aminopeptidase N n=1 Tax=Litoribacter ruber TaxID=702568 RepID=A0AAP2CK27_9BACT|nr:M1 family metallopeptidase [Litoribacter alkaliphilus]MBS9524010.1 M1 family metallopeptidase [Litoribacter alkaliphilus]